MRCGECKSDLDEFCLLDIVPNELVVKLLWAVILTKCVLGDQIPGKFSILSGRRCTNAMTGYSSARVAMR